MSNNQLSLLCLVALAAASLTGSVRADTIPLTGWNQDLIAEKTAANPVAGATANVSGWVWYEQGAPNALQGLPSGGLITSVYGAGVQFQLQPYNGNNVVVLDGTTTTATVALTTPKSFQSLQFLNSGQGIPGPTWNARLNFSDSTSTTLSSITDPDWTQGGGNNAVNNAGLVSSSATWSGFYTGDLHIFEHDFTLSTVDKAKVLNSITLTRTAGGPLMFFGLSGAPSAVPEPSTIALLSTGVLGLLACVWRRRR